MKIDKEICEKWKQTQLHSWTSSNWAIWICILSNIFDLCIKFISKPVLWLLLNTRHCIWALDSNLFKPWLPLIPVKHKVVSNVAVCALHVTWLLMKKLHTSDWLRAVQFKCNTSAKSATPVQIMHQFWIMIDRKTMRNFVCWRYHVKQWQKFCADSNNCKRKNVFNLGCGNRSCEQV